MSPIICRWRRFALIGAAATGGFASSAWADPAPPFAQLLQQSADAPRNRALEADVERAEGLAAQAGVRPNPTVSIIAENFAGGTPYGRYDRAETTVQYAQPIEIGGKRSARMAAGAANADAARSHARAGRITYAYELAMAYGEAEIADRRVSLIEDEIDEARDDLRIARAMVAAGKESRLRQVQAEAEFDTLQAQLGAARAARANALARLSALVGLDEPFTGLSEPLLGRLSRPVIIGPPDPMTNPAWLAAEADRKAAEARARFEQRRANPDVTVHIGARRFQAEGSTALVAGVSVPLPLFDRNRGNVAAADAEERAARARSEAARLEAKAAQVAAQADYDAADAQVAAAGRAVASAQEAYRMTHLAYQAGKIPLSEVITLRRGVGRARAALLEAEIARYTAAARRAALAGYSITGEPIS